MDRRRSFMTLLCILGFVASSGRARAFSPSSLFVIRGGQTIRFAAPKTGWLHNRPGDESSPGKDRDISNISPAAASEGTRSDEPRTGWLHNTKPKQTQKETAAAGSKALSEAQLLLQRAMEQQERNHRMIAPPAFHAGFDDQVLVVTEHKLSVPVYRTKNNNDDSRIDLFFSIVEVLKDEDWIWWKSLQKMEATKRAESYVEKAALENADQMMLYLQGGPGFGAPTPIVGLGFGSASSSWASEALCKYQRLVLMDQRGTGRSTPITKQRLQQDFPDLFLLDDQDTGNLPILEEFSESHSETCTKVKVALQKTTDFMAQFRADNIVKDAEEIKEVLMLPSSTNEPRPYGCALGQSFGGFCMMTYLSKIVHPPRLCLLTGGVAPMLTPVYDLYERLWDRVKDRSLGYYEMYPGDIAVVKRIVKALIEEPVTLPSQSKLTARRFLQIGLNLGGSPSSFAGMHKLFNTAFLNPDNEQDPTFTRAFLKAMDSEQSFDDHPLYFLMHESIYADGATYDNSPTDWAAHRAFESRVKTPSEFDYRLTSSLSSDARPTLFFGEMVFPWMAHGDYAEASGFGMRSLANALAQKQDWEPLYDASRMRAALEDGGPTVRAAAAVYHDDLYVDFDATMKVTGRGGPLEKCKVYVTNEYQHSGLRDDGATIFRKLHGMATGSIRTPS